MPVSYYSGIDDSGTQAFWDRYMAWLDQNKPGRGKYDKQIMRDPMNSSLARAANAGTAHAMKMAEQTYTVDPEIAANAPQVLAQQLNRQKQDIAANGFNSFLQAIAGAQEGAASRSAARKMNIYQIRANAGLQNLTERGRMMQAVQKTNPFMAALGIASPFAGLLASALRKRSSTPTGGPGINPGGSPDPSVNPFGYGM